jgi:hypothetical protein
MPGPSPNPPKPLSLSAVAVLDAITRRIRHGFDIMDAARLPSSGRAGGVAATTAVREKRPPRRYYEVTAAGAKALASSIEHYRTLGGRAAFASRTPVTE